MEENLHCRFSNNDQMCDKCEKSLQTTAPHTRSSLFLELKLKKRKLFFRGKFKFSIFTFRIRDALQRIKIGAQEMGAILCMLIVVDSIFFSAGLSGPSTGLIVLALNLSRKNYKLLKRSSRNIH